MKSLKTSLVFVLFLVGLLTILGSGGGGSDSGSSSSPSPSPPPSGGTSDRVEITDFSACSCDMNYCGDEFFENERAQFKFTLSNPDCNLDRLTLTFNNNPPWTAYPDKCATQVTSQCQKMNFDAGSQVKVVATAITDDLRNSSYTTYIKMLSTTSSLQTDGDEGKGDKWVCEDDENGCFFDVNQ